MIPATLATLALAVLVYAFILSPMLRELRSTSASTATGDDESDLELINEAEASATPRRTHVASADRSTSATSTNGVGNRDASVDGDDATDMAEPVAAGAAPHAAQPPRA